MSNRHTKASTVWWWSEACLGFDFHVVDAALGRCFAAGRCMGGCMGYAVWRAHIQPYSLRALSRRPARAHTSIHLIHHTRIQPIHHTAPYTEGSSTAQAGTPTRAPPGSASWNPGVVQLPSCRVDRCPTSAFDVSRRVGQLWFLTGNTPTPSLVMKTRVSRLLREAKICYRRRCAARTARCAARVRSSSAETRRRGAAGRSGQDHRCAAAQAAAPWCQPNTIREVSHSI